MDNAVVVRDSGYSEHDSCFPFAAEGVPVGEHKTVRQSLAKEHACRSDTQHMAGHQTRRIHSTCPDPKHVTAVASRRFQMYRCHNTPNAC